MPTTDLPQPGSSGDELLIQVQPDRVLGLDVPLLEQEFKSFAAATPHVTKFKVEQGDDGGRFINLHMKTEDLAPLWQAFRLAFYGHVILGAPLMQSSMALCTVEASWEDYLVLHHYDENVELDVLSEW